MKNPWFVLLIVAAPLGLAVFSLAQNPIPLPPGATVGPQAQSIPTPRRQANFASSGGGLAQQAPSDELLRHNYRVTLVVTQGEKKTEVILLTASPRINFDATVGETAPKVLIHYNGTLSEDEDGSLRATYSVGARVPEQLPGNNLQYQDEITTGGLHLTLGAAHPLFINANRTYTLTVTRDDGEKAKK